MSYHLTVEYPIYLSLVLNHLFGCIKWIKVMFSRNIYPYSLQTHSLVRCHYFNTVAAVPINEVEN